MASLTFKNLCKTYPNGFASVKDFSLEVADGSLVTLYGPHGCGKSTILRMIGGLEDITSGKIYLGDDLLNDIYPRDRKLAMAFQNYRLYGHLNVYETYRAWTAPSQPSKKCNRKSCANCRRILRNHRYSDPEDPHPF